MAVSAAGQGRLIGDEQMFFLFLRRRYVTPRTPVSLSHTPHTSHTTSRLCLPFSHNLITSLSPHFTHTCPLPLHAWLCLGTHFLPLHTHAFSLSPSSSLLDKLSLFSHVHTHTHFAHLSILYQIILYLIKSFLLSFILPSPPLPFAHTCCTHTLLVCGMAAP